MCFHGGMALPLKPPVLPQLARPSKTLPLGDGWVYEPKWDGFRTLAFVDGGDVYLQSRSGKPMTRYFPELAFPEGRYVLDGEVVLFDDAGPPGLRRARPADPPRRVAHPHARGADADALHRLRPARARRRGPARAARRPSAATGWGELVEKPVDLTPATEDPDEAQPWLQGAEGVIAKRQDAPYLPGRAQGHGEDQARAHDRRGRDGLAPRQGGEHRRLADPRPLRRRRASCAPSATPRA